MNTLKSRLLSAVAVAALALTPVAAEASGWKDPDLVDAKYAIDHITVEATQLLTLDKVKAENIKVVYLKEILSDADFGGIMVEVTKFAKQLEIITLKNTLNNVDVDVLNGNDVDITNFLNNLDVDANQLVGIEVFRDGRVLLFSGDESCGGGC